MALQIGSNVIVCTAVKGVFAGVLLERDGDKATLGDARYCVYWHESVHGMPGLANKGPNAKCRISPSAETVEIFGVTAILAMTDEAAAAWAAEPWS